MQMNVVKKDRREDFWSRSFNKTRWLLAQGEQDYYANLNPEFLRLLISPGDEAWLKCKKKKKKKIH